MGSKPEARQDNGTRRTKAELAGRVRGGGGARPVGNGFRGMNHHPSGHQGARLPPGGRGGGLRGPAFCGRGWSGTARVLGVVKGGGLGKAARHLREREGCGLWSPS